MLTNTTDSHTTLHETTMCQLRRVNNYTNMQNTLAGVQGCAFLSKSIIRTVQIILHVN